MSEVTPTLGGDGAFVGPADQQLRRATAEDIPRLKAVLAEAFF